MTSRGGAQRSLNQALRERNQIRTERDRAAIETDEKEELSIVKVRIVKALALMGVITFAVAVIILLLHYFGPESWHWLTPLQQTKVESVFGGSGATYLVVSLIRRYVDDSSSG